VRLTLSLSFDHWMSPKLISHCPFFSNVVWAADTNYRINLSNDEARTFAEQDDYDSLFAADQASSNIPTLETIGDS